MSTALSCEKNNDNNKNYFNLEHGINIILKNSNGELLLNTENYNPNNFKMYYNINGQKIEYNMPNYDSPKGFFINNDYSPNYVNFLLNSINQDTASSTTYIEWNENETDTIKATFLKGEGYFVIDKVWVNGDYVPFETLNDTIGHVVSIVK